MDKYKVYVFLSPIFMILAALIGMTFGIVSAHFEARAAVANPKILILDEG